MEIKVVHGDITKAEVEAIVNAANNHFRMGAGVAGAIKAAGGEIIEKEAMRQGPVMTGEAVATIAGNLPHKLVIHAAVMGLDLQTSAKFIRQATVSALNLAEKHKIKSIALPAFGTGVGGFPVKACANLMMSTVFGYKEFAVSLQEVWLVLFDDFGYKIFKQVYEEALSRLS